MSEAQLSPLSMQRVKAFFDDKGWAYEEDENGLVLHTGFSGVGMDVKFFAPSVSIVTTVAVDIVTANRFDEVLSWVEAHNYQKAYPSLAALKDVERDITALGASYTLPGQWEYTDHQFASHLFTGIQGLVQAARDFLGQFAPQVLEDLDRQRPGTA